MLALAGCPVDQTQVASNALQAECVPSGQSAPEGAWVCPAPRTIECDLSPNAPAQTLFVEQSETVDCEDKTLTIASQGSLTLGPSTITVKDAQGNAVCSSVLTLRDTVAPVLEARSIALWPPNHKLHSIAVEDCMAVRDACDPHVNAEFIWASSDEPVNGLGDGNQEPDIVIDDCRHVSLRSERQGPEDGRVYKLGVRATDAAGNTTESVCEVIVAHDQSGKQRSDSGPVVSTDAGRPNVAVTSDEAYRLVFDGSSGSPACGLPAAGTPEADGGTPDTDGETPDADAGTTDPQPQPDQVPGTTPPL